MKFEVRNGCYAYVVHKHPAKAILNNISFEAKSGQMLAVLGPNGVGKTTLLKCSMGLLPWQSGNSFLDGENIRSIPERHLWQRIAYVPQTSAAAHQFTAEEMVLIGRSPYLGPWQQPRELDRKKALDAMERVGIAYLRNKNCARMSGGEFQMVLVARALAGDPQLLVLDEPESNLDLKNQMVILQVLRRITDEQQICCIFNTHFPVHALRYSDTALLLNGDGTFMTGTSHEVITEGNLEHTFGVKVCVHDVKIDGNSYKGIIPLSLIS